jgi:uncharacterized cupredoxin-like copper-binding protein
LDHVNVRSVAALVGACVLTAGGLAVVHSRSHAPSPAAGSSVVHVTERDFQITAPEHVAAGDVELQVRNAGPDRHELIVVRRSSNTPLPLRADGLTLDEDALEASTVGIIEAREPNTVNALQLHLEPGNYVLFCNMAGHYLGGMHTEIAVG